MACALPAADILSLCLELVADDLSMSIGAILRRLAQVADAGQLWPALPEEVALHGALFWLGLDLHPALADNLVWPPPLDDVPLRAWAAPMLAHGSAYFNDEGEAWEAAGGPRLRCNKRLEALLAKPEASLPLELRRELDALGLARLAQRQVCALWDASAACPLTACWRHS